MCSYSYVCVDVCVLIAMFVSMCVCPCGYVCVDVCVIIAMFVSMCVSL